MPNDEETLPAGVQQGFFDTILSPFKKIIETWKKLWKGIGFMTLLGGILMAGYGGYMMYNKNKSQRESWPRQQTMLGQHAGHGEFGQHAMHGGLDGW